MGCGSHKHDDRSPSNESIGRDLCKPPPGVQGRGIDNIDRGARQGWDEEQMPVLVTPDSADRAEAVPHAIHHSSPPRAQRMEQSGQQQRPGFWKPAASAEPTLLRHPHCPRRRGKPRTQAGSLQATSRSGALPGPGTSRSRALPVPSVVGWRRQQQVEPERRARLKLWTSSPP